MNIYIEIIIVLVLLSLSAFFSCSETAFFSLNRADIAKLKRSNKRSSKLIIAVLQKPRDALISILLGNELVNVAFTITVAIIINELTSDVSWQVSIIISICIAAPLVLIFGEILPKNIAVRYASALTPVLVFPVRLFSKIVWPVRLLLTKLADIMVSLFGGDPHQVRSMIMEEEFRQLVDLSYKAGVIEEGESELIHRIFELGNKTVKEIMTLSGEIFKLPLSDPLEKMIREMRCTLFNRIPVYKTVPENIIGVLHSRDVFKLYRSRQKGQHKNIEEIVRPVYVIKESVTIESLMEEFQKRKVHIAIVKNDQEETVGLVTMDDIFRLLFTKKLEDRVKVKMGNGLKKEEL